MGQRQKYEELDIEKMIDIGHESYENLDAGGRKVELMEVAELCQEKHENVEADVHETTEATQENHEGIKD